jgi:hypothetical protein
MNTDYQTNTNFRAITPQGSGFDPEFLPELFLYLSAIALATADP